jgi:hypothetical protein
MGKVKATEPMMEDRVLAGIAAERSADALVILGNQVARLGNPVEGEEITLLACKLRNMPKLAFWRGVSAAMTLAAPASTAPPLTVPLSAAAGQSERKE